MNPRVCTTCIFFSESRAIPSENALGDCKSSVFIRPIPNLRERVILMNHRIEVVWKGWVNIYEQGGSEFHAKSTAINTIPSLPGTKVSLNLLLGPN